MFVLLVLSTSLCCCADVNCALRSLLSDTPSRRPSNGRPPLHTPIPPNRVVHFPEWCPCDTPQESLFARQSDSPRLFNSSRRSSLHSCLKGSSYDTFKDTRMARGGGGTIFPDCSPLAPMPQRSAPYAQVRPLVPDASKNRLYSYACFLSRTILNGSRARSAIVMSPSDDGFSTVSSIDLEDETSPHLLRSLHANSERMQIQETARSHCRARRPTAFNSYHRRKNSDAENEEEALSECGAMHLLCCYVSYIVIVIIMAVGARYAYF